MNERIRLISPIYEIGTTPVKVDVKPFQETDRHTGGRETAHFFNLKDNMENDMQQQFDV